MEKIKMSCTTCRQDTAVPVYSNINVSVQPSLKEKVLSGELFLWECPHCGRSNLATYPVLYHDPEARLMVWLVPDNSVSDAQMKALSAQLDALDGYTFRRVDNVGSLIEKVAIFEAGLDDRVIEMAKYVTAMELAEANADRASEYLDASFRFFKMDGVDNEIALTYPSGGQMQVVAIGFNVYEDCRGIIARNKSVTDVSGFVRVDRNWVRTFLR